jgi:hypothetical protein
VFDSEIEQVAEREEKSKIGRPTSSYEKATATERRTPARLKVGDPSVKGRERAGRCGFKKLGWMIIIGGRTAAGNERSSLGYGSRFNDLDLNRHSRPRTIICRVDLDHYMHGLDGVQC